MSTASRSGRVAAGPGRPRLVEQRRRGATAREEILDAAAELFCRHGYTGTSTRMIAEAVGIRQASMYHYFKNKDDILAALLDGRIKGIAISSKRRARFFPNIPTFDEQGLKGYEVGGWFGLVGPAGIPPDVLAKLNAAMVTALKDPEVVQRIHDIGMEPQPMTPSEFGAHIDREIDKITKVLAQAGDVPKDEPAK